MRRNILGCCSRIMRDIPKNERAARGRRHSPSRELPFGQGHGYPHPNRELQPITRGDSLQVACWGRHRWVRREQSASIVVAPGHWQEKVWEVHTRGYADQAEQSVCRNTCSERGQAVHDAPDIATGLRRPRLSQAGATASASKATSPRIQALGDLHGDAEGDGTSRTSPASTT